MAETAMCRICLNDKLRLFSISNTDLQDTLEKLSNIKLNSDTGAPILVCYICHAHLRKCDQLRIRTLRAEVLLNEMINNSLKLSSGKNYQADGQYTELGYNYNITIPHYVEFKENSVSMEEFNIDEVYIKKEKMEDDEALLDVDVKVENFEVDVHIEENFDLYENENIPEKPKKMASDKIQHKKIIKKRKGVERIINDSNCVPVDDTSRSKLVKPETDFYMGTKSAESMTEDDEANGNDKWKPGSMNSNKVNLYSCKICTNISDGEICIHCASDHITGSSEWIRNEGDVHKMNPDEAHISISVNKSPSPSQLQAQKKRYLCKYCGSEFANRKTLKIHTMGKHTGERRFSCQFCQYTFVKKYDLDRHTRTHTGEKPYVCKHCKYRSATRDGVRAHLARKHSKQKTFS